LHGLSRAAFDRPSHGFIFHFCRNSVTASVAAAIPRTTDERTQESGSTVGGTEAADREKAILMGEEHSKEQLKTTAKRLLIYDDSAVYGGHQVMMLGILEHLVETGEYDIAFVYFAGNSRLETELTKIQSRFPGLSLVESSYNSGRLQFLRTLWAVGAVRRTREAMRKLRPDCVVVVQGEISLSAVGVFAGIRESILTISYIPLAHSRRQRGESKLPWLKDAILWWYYRLPDRFIAISNSVSSMLRSRGASQPIDVVENGVNLSDRRKINKAEARARLDLPSVGYVAALCGRIEFMQKGHDVLLKVLEDRAEEFSDWVFLVVGDGPDNERLAAMIRETSLEDRVTVKGWQNDMSFVYSAIDMLLLPSRFEGVPVTMLEAMYYDLPIVASATDAMAEVLPLEWLFPVGDSDSFADALLRVRSHNNLPLLERNRCIVETRFTQEQQRRRFADVLNHCIDTVRGLVKAPN
jgi:glycosyltransferase involved in cell wall biosynthesis